MNEDKNAPKQEEDLPPLTREDVYLTMAMIQQSVKQCAPFYSWAILNMVPHVTRDLPTAGVSYIDGRFHIFYNPEFMFKCLEDKGTNGVADVVRHEVMHIMHDHLHDDRIPSLARIPEEVKGWEGFIRDDVSAEVAAVKTLQAILQALEHCLRLGNQPLPPALARVLLLPRKGRVCRHASC